MSGKPFVEVQVAAEQRALLVARREVIQGVDVDTRGWDITYQYSLCLNTATVSGCIWSKYILV